MAEIENIGACVFDAYGTLFNVNSAAAQCQDELGDKWMPLSQLWRDKQLQYTWLRSLMGDHYAPFWQLTQDALDFALEAHEIDNPSLRQKLLDIYFELDAYPEVPAVLSKLKAAGIKTATLSNGSQNMLDAAVGSSGIALDAVISVDPIKVFKPDFRVYELGCEVLGVSKEQVCFMSSNGWDAWGAANFGFKVVWINRSGQPLERLPSGPGHILSDLNGLPPLLGL